MYNTAQPRSIKSILIVFRDQIQKGELDNGMCLTSYNFDGTPQERSLLMDYLDDNAPITWYRFFGVMGYWWKPGRIAPRVKWLNKQIKKLN